MDFDIKEIGATLLIGAFAFLAIEASLYHLLGIDITGFFHGRIGFSDERPKRGSDRATPPVPFMVFLGLSLIFGIFAEDIAMRTIEEHPELVAQLPTYLSALSGPPDQYRDKKALRRSVLVDPKHSLIQELVQAVAEICTSSSKDPDEDCASAIYHTAKNRVFLEGNYYDELKRIEIRRHLAAGLCICSLGAIPMAIIMLALSFFGLTKLGRASAERTTKESKTIWSGAIKAVVISGLASIAIFFAAILSLRLIGMKFPAATELLSSRVLLIGIGSVFLPAAIYHIARALEANANLEKKKLEAIPGPHKAMVMAALIVATFAVINIGSFWAYGYESEESYRRVFGYYATLLRYENTNKINVPGSNPLLLPKIEGLIRSAQCPQTPCGAAEANKHE